MKSSLGKIQGAAANSIALPVTAAVQESRVQKQKPILLLNFHRFPSPPQRRNKKCLRALKATLCCTHSREWRDRLFKTTIGNNTRR